MLALFLIGGSTALWAEHQPNPALAGEQVQQSGPMEGKESRFGTTASVLWTVTTTAASNGSVNAMHSLNPLTGMVAMVNMMVGEVILACRRRAVRHVAVRVDRRVPGRADDWSYAGVPGQEAAGP